MAVSIYKYPELVIELSLVAGGSLDANTTYYFSGYYFWSAMWQWALWQQYSITTDTTNRSIRVRAKRRNGTAWDYNRPVLSFYPTNLSYYNILWSKTDMMSWGSYVFNSTFANNFIVEWNAQTYDVTYTTNPVVNSTNNYYRYVPERRWYGMTAGSYLWLLGFWLTQWHPIVYTGSASDTRANLVTAIKTAWPSVINYRFSNWPLDNTTLLGYFSIYNAYNVLWNDLNIDLICGNLYSAGRHNRCVINTSTYLNGFNATGNGIGITAGDNNYLRWMRYRQSFIIWWVDNSITSFWWQIGISKNDSSYRKFINTFLLTNSMDNNNNFSMYNSLLYYQWMPTNEYLSNIYQSTQSAIVGWVHDMVFMNSFFNWPTTLTITDYVIDTDRATSEGINYTVDKKPRIQWSIGTGTYVNKTLLLKDTIKVYAVDKTGTPLSNVSIGIQNGFETVTGTTDANGYLALPIKTRTAVQDPAYTTTNYYTIWTDYTKVTLKATKAGYGNSTIKINTLKNKTINLTMYPAKPVLLDDSWNLYINTDKENIGKPIIVSI